MIANLLIYRGCLIGRVQIEELFVRRYRGFFRFSQRIHELFRRAGARSHAPAYGSCFDHRRHVGTQRMRSAIARRRCSPHVSGRAPAARRAAITAVRASAAARGLFAADAARGTPARPRLPLGAGPARRPPPVPGARLIRDTAVRRRNGQGNAKPTRVDQHLDRLTRLPV